MNIQRFFRFEILAIPFLLLWVLGQIPFGWLPDVASHFQVQYVIALTVLLILALSLRLWRWLLILLCAFIVSLLAIAPYWPTSHPQQVLHPDLRIMQANVLFKNHEYNQVIEVIQYYDPDILSLQEVDPTWISALQPALKKYPYHVERMKRGRIYGVALYSKLPLKNPAVHYYSDVGRPNLFAEIQVKGQPVSLVAMHPYSPGRPRKYRWRDQQLFGFAKARHTFHQRLILIGDLNNTPFSSSFKAFLKQTGLQNTRLGRGIYLTWPAYSHWIKIPIDHILVSPEFEVTSFQTGPPFASDHLPLVVDLVLKTP